MGLCEEKIFLLLLPPYGRQVVWNWKSRNGTSIRVPGSASKDCFVELVNVFAAAIIIIATVVLVKHNSKKKLINKLLPLHTIRTILCLVLLLLVVFEFCESLLIFAPFSPFLSILAVVSCWVVHRQTEMRDCFGVSISGGGFIIITIARTWRLLYLRRFGLTILHIQAITTAGTAVCCGVLAIIDAYTLYGMKKKKYTEKSIENIQYAYKYASSTFLSKITFHWVVNLLVRGYRNPLDLQDLGNLPEAESAKIQFEKFQNIYKNEKELKGKDKLSLWICYWKHLWLPFTIGGLLKLLGDASNLVGPMAISKIIDYVSITQNVTANYWKFEHSRFVTLEQFFNNGYILGLLVFLAAILQSTLSQTSTHILSVEGIRLRTALQASIYEKALRLCSWSISEDEKPPNKWREKEEQGRQIIDIGTLTNLMAEDAYNVMGFFWIGHYIWAIPLKIIAIVFLLYLKLGISAIIGVVLSILTVTPMQLYLGKCMSNNAKCITERSDARLKLINEILQGIRLVKLRAWEDLFEKRITQTRNRELELLDKDSLLWGFITFLTHASSVLTTLFTFGVYFWLEEKNLDAGSVFSSLALFSQLTVPLFIFPVIVPIIINAMISTKRLEDFLSLPEIINILPEAKEKKAEIQERSLDTDVEANNVNVFGHLDNIEEDEEDFLLKNNSNSKTHSIFVKEHKTENFTVKVSGIFSWGMSETLLTINDLIFPRGKLTIIVGKTGSGKTSLISALLGEMQRVSGKVEWTRDARVAYVSQKPWLINATLRDNILFGSEYKPRRYKHVLKVCALQPDVDILPGRDLTMIGEKGINLSGGQKQRIAIARAIYSDCNTIILDDPLSALDQQVGQQIFNQGIQKLLLRKYSIIMITCRLELMPFADQIVAMESCKVRATGTKSFIEKSDPKLSAEWKEAAKRKVEDYRIQKTAKDRWSLIRLISRISISIRQRNNSDGSWITDQDAYVTPPTFVPLRLRRSILFGSRYLAYDLSDMPVTAEEWNGIVRRRSRKHRLAIRATSLQPLKHPPPVLRQSSTPTIMEGRYVPPRRRHNTLDNNMLKQLFSGSSITFSRIVNSNSEEVTLSREKSILRRLISPNLNKVNQNQEWDHRPVKRLLSTESTATEEAEDEEEKSIDELEQNDNQYEEESGGLVTLKVWLTYFKVGGIVSGMIYIFAALGCQVLRVYTDLWLSRWTEQDYHPEYSEVNHQNMIFYCRVYIILSICSILLYAICNGAGQWVGAKARRQLHHEAVLGLLQTPLSFFDQTPVGRILNRFSADIGVIDKKLSISIQRLASFILLCVSAMLVNIVISPWYIIPAIPTCGIYYLLQRFYRRSARELQRLDGSSRGPLSAHFSETLAGLQTIRASRQQGRFINQMFQHIDTNTNAFLILNTSSRWLGIALDYLGAVIVIAAIFAALMSAQLYPNQITPALVGLAINYTFLVPIYLNWVVKFISEIEMYMGSVARISSFSTIPTESQEDNFDQIIPSDWPKNGEILFDNASLRYDNQRDPVVSNLDLLIPAGTKLGICGRTGSGKSTTAMSLFRMVDLSQGRILIDGIDIRNVPIQILRSRLSVIPQDVIIFSGTIRENLDPFSEFTDAELWSALEIAQMKSGVFSHPNVLNLEVREGGENFSAGQLQLINMARAALKKSSIVIFDEATSALDASTEKSLLQTASEIFKKKTVITIAHRVAALMACDRILVFEDGKIVEDGTPKDLMQRPMGFFTAMLRATEDADEIS